MTETAHNLITSAKALHNLDVLSSKLVDEKIFFQPAASSLDGLASPSIILSVAFVALSASIEANLIACTSSYMSGNNTSRSALRLGGCFCFKYYCFLRGGIPIFMLSVRNLVALWTLPFLFHV